MSRWHAAAVLCAAGLALLAVAGPAFGWTNDASTARAMRAVHPTAASLSKAAVRGATGATIPATTFKGFAFCLDPRNSDWPAYDPTHQATITLTYWVHADNPSYTNAQTVASPFYFVGFDLNHFYKYRLSDGALLAGPVTYAKTSVGWIPDARPEYDRAYNMIWFKDGSTTTSAGTALLEHVGPQNTAGTGCYFP